VSYILDVKKSATERAPPARAVRRSVVHESALWTGVRRGELLRQVDEARSAQQLHRTSGPKASDVDFTRRIVGMFDERSSQ